MTDYSLECVKVDFALTGQAATLLTARKMTCTMQMYNLITDSIQAMLSDKGTLFYLPLNDFNGCALNEVVNGWDAKSFGVGLCGAEGIGDGNLAALMNGKGGYLNIYSSNLGSNFNGNEGWLMVWVKIPASVWSDGSIDRVVYMKSTDNTNQISVHKLNTTGNFGITYKAGNVAKTVTWASGSPTTWMCVIMTWSKSNNRARMYINGSQVGTDQTGLGTWSSAITTALIGAYDTYNSEVVNGYLAHFAIGSRELSSAEVASIYSSALRTKTATYLPLLNYSDTRAAPSPDIWVAGIKVGELLAGVSGNELIMGSGDFNVSPVIGTLTCFDAEGNVQWTYNSPNNDFIMGVDIGDLDDDGTNDVVLGTRVLDHACIALDKDGGFLWSYDAGTDYVRATIISKFREDYTGKQVAIAGSNGKFSLLDKDGGQIWSILLTDPYYATAQSLAVSGTNIVVGCGASVRLHNNAGAETWKTVVGDATSYVYGVCVSGSYIYAAVGGPAITTFDTNECVCLDLSGNILWRTSFPNDVYSVAAGNSKVFVGYGSHYATIPDVGLGGVAVLDGTSGEIIGNISLPSSIKFVEYGDVDNDTTNEIIAACDDGHAYIIEENGIGYLYEISGLYSWTTITVQRKLALAQGSLALSGQDAGLLTARQFALAYGTFALSGQDSGVLAGWLFALAVGAFALTGNAATLTPTYNRLGSVTGSDAAIYSVTGSDSGES